MEFLFIPHKRVYCSCAYDLLYAFPQAVVILYYKEFHNSWSHYFNLDDRHQSKGINDLFFLTLKSKTFSTLTSSFSFWVLLNYWWFLNNSWDKVKSFHPHIILSFHDYFIDICSNFFSVSVTLVVVYFSLLNLISLNITIFFPLVSIGIVDVHYYSHKNWFLHLYMFDYVSIEIFLTFSFALFLNELLIIDYSLTIIKIMKNFYKKSLDLTYSL